jgi:uncharacterized protein YjbI with pentapeptide repeats
MESLEFVEMDLAGQSFAGQILDGASFVDTDLSGCDFTDASLRGASFDNVVLDGAIFDGADLTDATFTNVISAEDVRFMGAILDGAVGVPGVVEEEVPVDEGADVSGPEEDYEEVDIAPDAFVNADLSGFDFTGANFSGAKFDEADLSGADLTRAILPADLVWTNNEPLNKE